DSSNERYLDEKPVGYLSFMCRISNQIVRTEQGARRQNRIGACAGQAEVDDLIDLMTVDGERQRPAIAHVAIQLAPDGIVGVQVRIKGQIRAGTVAPEQDAVATALLALLQECVVGESQILALQHALACAGLGR